MLRLTTIDLHTLMRAVAIVFIGVLFSICGARADDQKRILILHSYHQGLEWTDAITNGFGNVTRPLGKKAELYYEYLDTLRNNDPDSFETLASLIQLKYNPIRFDVIVAAGDAALRFSKRHASQLFADVPVVFCDINSFDPDLYSGSQITGIIKQIDYLNTLSVMLKLHPDCRRITIIVDQTPSANAMRRHLETILPSISEQVETVILQDYRLSEIPDRLRLLGPNDLVYLLSFNQDKDGRLISNSDGIELLARWSPAPIYSSWGYYLGKGIVGGMITSGSIQGEQVAQLALRIISGERAEDIPVITRSPNLFMFDYHQLQRFEIDADMLPPGSVVINRPAGLLVEYGNWLLSIGTVTLLVVIVLLGCFLLQRRGHEHLNRTHAELARRVRQDGAELQMIQHKLKKQSVTDQFTGLNNKRFIHQRLVEESKKALRYHYPLTVLVLDIDHFRQVNHTHGHTVGDRVLRDVAQTIRHTLREIDLVGRHGGGAFMVVLPSTGCNAAMAAAERIRRTIHAIKWENGQVRVTISGGLAELKGFAPADLIKLAEERLHLAKSQGRDRIVCAGGCGEADRQEHGGTVETG